MPFHYLWSLAVLPSGLELRVVSLPADKSHPMAVEIFNFMHDEGSL
jgi:hypothetical protein